MPDRAGGVWTRRPHRPAPTVRLLIPLHSWQHCPRENTVKPSGGIARFSLSAWACKTPIVAFAGTCGAGFLCVACADDYRYYFGVCYAIVSLEKGDVTVGDRGIFQEKLFFFSLLKRKKEAKKEKLSPTLVGAAVYRTKGNAIFVTQNINPPEGEQAACLP